MSKWDEEKIAKREAKRLETKSNSLPQMSDPTERETHILIDYPEDKIIIYSNNITVINRMARKGYKHTKEDLIDGNVYSRTYEFPIDMMAKFATVSIFK